MFSHRREIRRINELKLIAEAERVQLTAQASYFTPLVGKTARVGIYAMAVKNLAPAVRPILFGLIQRGLARHGKMKLFKLAGLMSTGIGLARAFSAPERSTEKASLK